MADSTHPLQDAAIAPSMDTAHLPGREVLDRTTFRALNRRSDLRGIVHLLGHGLVILSTGFLVHAAHRNVRLLLPAMLLHGFALVTLFAPMHECVHRTAFRSRWLNQVVGWITGVVAFYDSAYYRRYHYWHHRFTQDPNRDPELMVSKPRTVAAYWWRLSGLPFWYGKVRDMIVVASGHTARWPFIPPQVRGRLIWSTRAQIALYLLIATGAIVLGSTAPLLYWVVPVVLGQPGLRAITLAEHTGCSGDTNGLTNTRTTLTSWPVRFLMWNMPYHAEHHLYPSIPFHALSQAHVHIRARLVHLDSSYIVVNRTMVTRLANARHAAAQALGEAVHKG